MADHVFENMPRCAGNKITSLGNAIFLNVDGNQPGQYSQFFKDQRKAFVRNAFTSKRAAGQSLSCSKALVLELLRDVFGETWDSIIHHYAFYYRPERRVKSAEWKNAMYVQLTWDQHASIIQDKLATTIKNQHAQLKKMPAEKNHQNVQDNDDDNQDDEHDNDEDTITLEWPTSETHNHIRSNWIRSATTVGHLLDVYAREEIQNMIAWTRKAQGNNNNPWPWCKKWGQAMCENQPWAKPFEAARKTVLLLLEMVCDRNRFSLEEVLAEFYAERIWVIMSVFLPMDRANALFKMHPDGPGIAPSQDRHFDWYSSIQKVEAFRIDRQPGGHGMLRKKYVRLYVDMKKSLFVSRGRLEADKWELVVPTKWEADKKWELVERLHVPTKWEYRELDHLPEPIDPEALLLLPEPIPIAAMADPNMPPSRAAFFGRDAMDVSDHVSFDPFPGQV